MSPNTRMAGDAKDVCRKAPSTIDQSPSPFWFLPKSLGIEISLPSLVRTLMSLNSDCVFQVPTPMPPTGKLEVTVWESDCSDFSMRVGLFWENSL